MKRGRILFLLTELVDFHGDGGFFGIEFGYEDMIEILRSDPSLKRLNLKLLLFDSFVLMTENSSDRLIISLKFRVKSGKLLMTKGIFEDLVKCF